MIRTVFVDDALPLDIQEVRQALRVRHTLETALLERKFRASIAIFERRTTRLLRRHRLEQLLTDWPTDSQGCYPMPIELERAPVREVLSLEIRNAAGGWVEVDPATWEFRRSASGGTVDFLGGATRPALAATYRDAIRVTFEAGYETGEETGSADDPELMLPDEALEAVLLMTGHFYENREATTDAEKVVLPLGIDAIVQGLRIFR